MAATGCNILEKERITVNGHPVLLLKVLDEKTNKQYYITYIGMMIATNNIFIAYLPPVDNTELGAYVWQQWKKSIKESNKRVHSIAGSARSE